MAALLKEHNDGQRTPAGSDAGTGEGVAQAARIVDQLSRTGTYPVDYLEASLRSLFSFEAADVAEVFGTIQGVKLGLKKTWPPDSPRVGMKPRGP